MEGAVSQGIDWDQAKRSGEMVHYMNTVKSHLAPLFNTSHGVCRILIRSWNM